MLLLGEISSALPGELRDNHPEVAWRQIRAFRNLAVHKYFGVDWAVVWKIAQEEPALLETQAGVAVDSRSAEELLKDGSGPRRDVLIGKKSLHIWTAVAAESTPIISASRRRSSTSRVLAARAFIAKMCRGDAAVIAESGERSFELFPVE
jgi:hypothetical protein